VGGGDSLGQLREALLADGHETAVLAIKDGTVHESNAAARRLFTQTPRGRTIRELFDERSEEKLREHLRRGSSGATPELQVLRADGPPVATRFLVVAFAGEHLLIAEHGDLGHSDEISEKLVAANSDLANLTRELSRRMHEIESAKQALEAASDMRELFIAALAHDLKTPLTVILLNEGALRKQTAPLSTADRARHADKVERNVKRMLRLIDNLLLAARLEADVASLGVESFESVRVDNLARDIAREIEPLANDARLSIVVTAHEPVCVRGNGAWLGQVFANLLTNATRHSEAGTCIEVTVEKDGPEAKCTVADRGPGIAALDRERLFDRFAQRGERRGNIGLGLYVCRKILSLHGGRIWIEDNPGGGARFVFCLNLGS
jgi:signal transduction histidine kinase